MSEIVSHSVIEIAMLASLVLVAGGIAIEQGIRERRKQREQEANLRIMRKSAGSR